MAEKKEFNQLSQANKVIWKTQVIPVEIELFWSAFDDFVALKRHYPFFNNVKVEEGNGGIGTVISYDFLDCRMKEKLTWKDDHVKACKIESVQPNSLFSIFNITIKVNNVLSYSEFKYACEITIVISVEFAKQVYADEQATILEKLDYTISDRIQDIVLYITKKKGEYVVQETRIYCGIDSVWKRLINWGRAFFSKGASCVELAHDKKTRIIHFGKKISVERFRSMSAALHIVVYEILKSDLASVQYCYGSYNLVEINPFVTQLIHELYCIPDKESLRKEVNKQITTIMEEQMRMISGTCFNSNISPISEVCGKYFFEVDGNVRASKKEIWSLVRCFDKAQKWCSYIDYLEMEPPGEDTVGAVRIVRGKTTKHYFRERLENRDDKECILKTFLQDWHNAPVKITDVLYTLSLKTISENVTKVIFLIRFNAPNSLIASFINQSLEPSFMDAIKELDKYFNSVIGHLELTIIKGSNLRRTKSLFNPDPYVEVYLENNQSQKTKICRGTTEPYWNQKILFSIEQKHNKIKFIVWDYDFFGKNDLIGTAEMNFTEMQSGIEKMEELKLDVQGSISIRLVTEMKKGEDVPLPPERRLLLQLLRVQSYVDNIQDNVQSVWQSLLHGTNDNPYEWDHFKRSKSEPLLALEELPGFSKTLPPDQLLSPKKYGRLFERYMEFLHSQVGFLQRVLSVDKWSAAFQKWLNPPKPLLSRWETDDEFCRQFVEGVNPMMIRLCRSIEEIPDDMRELMANNTTVKQFITAKKLFMVDYKILKDIPAHMNFKLYAPTILMYLDVDSSNSKLKILGIQLTQNPDNNTIYTPSSPPNRYLFAKMHVSCADYQIHQFVFHLGLTHLLTEAIAVSYNNYLKLTNHPLVDLLDCHFKETIGINFLARNALLMSAAPFTCHAYAVGLNGGLNLFLNYWHKFNFMQHSFPNDLRRRGFTERCEDGLKNYYYREDGFKIWNALVKYVSDFINQEYVDDYSVANDKVLQMFAASIISPSEGNIPGFPYKFETKASLVDCLVNIIFTCSVQHAAVNSPQYYYNTFIPNRPISLINYMPEGDDDISWEFIQNSLPTIDVGHFQIMSSYLMTLPSTTSLLRLQSLKQRYPIICKNLQDELKSISENIKERNIKMESEDKVPYSYLDPENISICIDI